MSSPATTDNPRVETAPATRSKVKPKQPPMYHVVLHDDNDHTYDYVMRMLQSLFAKDLEASFRMARQVDTAGRVVCETTWLERAEFKRAQMLSFGADPLISRCKGPMTVTLEPADDEADGK